MIDRTLDQINKIIPQRWQWLLAHGGFRRYFKNTSWMLVGQLMSIVSLLVNIWVARYLGPEEFGSFSYVIAFIGIFSFIANLGIADVIIKELVNNPEDRDKTMGTSFRLLFFSGLIAFFVSSASAFIFEQNTFLRLLIILASSSFLFSSFNIIPHYFQASVLAKKNAIAQMITIVVSSAFKIYLILSTQSLLFFVLAFLLDSIIFTIIYLVNYRREGLNFWVWKYDKTIFKKIFSASVLLMFAAAAGYLLMKVDQVMIKSYLDEAAVGYYAAAVKMSEAWYFIPGIICTSLFPAIINAKKVSASSYKKRLTNLFIFLFLFALIIALVISLCSGLIIKILYGPSFLASVPVLRIYVWSSLGMFLIAGINKYLLVENKLKQLFLYNVSAVLINIALNIYLLPRVGLLGAAWATLISYSLWPILVFLTEKVFKKKIIKPSFNES